MPRRCSFAGVILALCLAIPFSLGAETTAREYYRLGREALDNDDPYTAVASLREALRINDAYSDARLGLAEAYFRLGEYEQARLEIDEARITVSDRRDLTIMEARILTALRKYDEAGLLYQSVLATRPHDPEANRGLAELQAIRGRPGEAARVYEIARRYDPGDRRTLLQLVVLHDESGERKTAEGVLQEALRRFGDDPLTRIQAAEHYARYGEWEEAIRHLDRAEGLAGERGGEALERRIVLLAARIDLRRDDPETALLRLAEIPDADELDALFLTARAHRAAGDEERAQRILHRIVGHRPDDETTRIFREDPLVQTYGGYEEHRRAAAAYHLAKGVGAEEAFYYDRAFREYRRAKLIFKDDPAAWLAYADLVRKKGFPDRYRELLDAALDDIPPETADFSRLAERKELLDHSRLGGLADEWGIEDPWGKPRDSWAITVFVMEEETRLPLHEGSEEALGRFVAYALVDGVDVDVVPPDLPGYPRTFSNPTITATSDFSEAFRDSRDVADYFLLLAFTETDRTFECRAGLYLARTGERVREIRELRTGKDRVSEVLYRVAGEISSLVPPRAGLAGLDGPVALLDRGRWHGVEEGQEWMLVKRDATRPDGTPSGLAFSPEDRLGVLTVTDSDEALAQGTVRRVGAFDFLSIRDQAFLIPVSEEEDPVSPQEGDPSLRLRLLAIP